MKKRKMLTKIKMIPAFIRFYFLLRKFSGMRICSEEEAQDIAGLIGYRAQLALYELHSEQERDLSWDEFVQLVQRSPAIRKKTQSTVLDAIVGFDKSLLDFELPVDALEYREDDGEEAKIVAVQIFPQWMSLELIKFVFLLFEMEHFRRLRLASPSYTWKEYCKDLSNDRELWNKFTRGLQQGIRQIDFKPFWKANAAQEEIKRLEFGEEA